MNDCKKPTCGSCLEYFPFFGMSKGFCMEAHREGFDIQVSSLWEACPRYHSLICGFDEVRDGRG